MFFNMFWKFSEEVGRLENRHCRSTNRTFLWRHPEWDNCWICWWKRIRWRCQVKTGTDVTGRNNRVNTGATASWTAGVPQKSLHCTSTEGAAGKWHSLTIYIVGMQIYTWHINLTDVIFRGTKGWFKYFLLRLTHQTMERTNRRLVSVDKECIWKHLFL